MKKLHLIILLATISFCSMAQTVGDAFYIYRNDGQFNAFFRDEVKSIEYSYYDADSTKYNEIVTQVITTEDSVYMIPLAVIDSVSFVQPIPILKDDAIEINESFVKHIVSVDSTTIKLEKNTPTVLIPKAGEKLVQLHFSDIFPDGFVGNVLNVTEESNTIRIDCENIAIEDAVKRFYGIYRITTYNSPSNSTFVRLARSPKKDIFSKQILGGRIPVHVDANLLNLWRKESKIGDSSFDFECDLMAYIEPVMNITVSVSVDNFIGIAPKYTIHTFTNLDIEDIIKPAGVFSGEYRRSFVPDMFSYIRDIPIVPGVNAYWDAGFKVSGEGKIGVGICSNCNFDYIMDFDVYPTLLLPNPLLTNALMPKVIINSSNLKINKLNNEWLYFFGEADIKITPYFEVGFSLIKHEIAKIGGELGLGFKLNAAVTHNTDEWKKAEEKTTYYDNIMNNCKIETGFYGEANIFVAFFEKANLFGETSGEKNRISIGGDMMLGSPLQAFLMPVFKNVSLTRKADDPSSLTAFSNLERNCLIPLSLGFSLFNSKNELIKHIPYNLRKYRIQEDMSDYSVDFSVTEKGHTETYKVFPTINFFGKTILCSPGADVQEILPAKITEFKQTDSHYLRDGYTYKGKKYSYEYEYAVTMELESETGVEDWGYVYEDENGDTAHVSFMGYESPYTNTQYVFYRNEKQSVAKIYEYVKYIDAENFYHGDAVTYNLLYVEQLCPDENHPHMVDLGLPSGTKWACCNVGAKKPEEYGTYYAWGETSAKQNYIESTCVYYGVNVGQSIANTSRDAASVMWSQGWHMPSENNASELIENCDWSWEEYQGVAGTMFTSRLNSTKLFLPAAGQHPSSTDGENKAGTIGHYWLGESYKNNTYAAWHMGLKKTGPYTKSLFRWRGITIRPVNNK